jgi:hypothetical protein
MFRDDVTALAVDAGGRGLTKAECLAGMDAAGSGMICWGDTDGFLLDRYDGRNLLVNIAEFKKKKRFSALSKSNPELAAQEADCDLDRYKDLGAGADNTELDGQDPLSAVERLEQRTSRAAEAKVKSASASGKGAFGAVAFSYGDSNADTNADTETTMAENTANESESEEEEDGEFAAEREAFATAEEMARPRTRKTLAASFVHWFFPL